MGTAVIREAEAADWGAIAAIQVRVPEAAGWKVEDYFSYQVDVACVEEVLAGFLVTRRLVEGESEVLNLAILPEYRRRGFARGLLERAMGRWPGRWFLEVRVSNVSALGCYENLGFRRIGVRPGYYPTENGKSPEEGIVMERSW